MKFKLMICRVFVAVILLSPLFNCKKGTLKTIPTPPTPTVTISATTEITAITASSGGEITADGGSFVYLRGVCWSTNQNPTTSDCITSNGSGITSNGSGTGSFSSSLTGLTPDTTYYIRAYAINSAGTGYSNQAKFTTLGFITYAVSTILSTSATSGGRIPSDGGAAVTARGVCWSTSQMPTTGNFKTFDGAGAGGFITDITGLNPNTTYYVRAYATNSQGTVYGNQVSFTTADTGTGTVTDIDGNVYQIVKIGTQVWMAENLKTTKYRNGDPIPNVTEGGTAWAALTTGAYRWYLNNAATYKATYGALYNWYSVADSRNLAPIGWHVSTDAEWNTLTTFLDEDGGKLKETGFSHWRGGYIVADTNATGFTALPGGCCHDDGTYSLAAFYSLLSFGCWWSSTAEITKPRKKVKEAKP